MAVELSLARLLSALYFQPLVYLLLSVAVLGLGLGAALVAAIPALRRVDRAVGWAAFAGVAATLLAPAALALAHGVPGRGGSLATVPTILTLALALLPYVGIGASLASVFAARPAASPGLYAADLIAAGAAAALSVPLLAGPGAVAGLLFAGLALALAAPLLAPTASTIRGRSLAWAAPVVAAMAVAVHAAAGVPSLDYARLATPKPIVGTLTGGASIETSRWGALARADLVVDRGLGTQTLYLDGAAGSLVPDPNRRDRWGLDIGALPYAVADRFGASAERAFLIGPGGGLDVALARAAGVDDIVAAELSRAGIALVRATAEGAVWYDADDVRLLVDEGRSALRREAEPFDVIALSHVVTQAAEVRQFALTENGLYTVEAFGEYLSALTSSGALSVKLYDELTLTRALATALTALVAEEIAADPAAATRHVFAALDRRSDPPAPLLLVRNTPFDLDGAVAAARTAEALGFGLLAVPGLLEPPALASIAAGRAGVDALDADPTTDISPTRDDRPFFFRFDPGLPRQVRPLAVGGAAILALAVALWLLSVVRAAPSVRTERAARPLVFAGLGAGFLLIESWLLQVTGLVLGSPSLTLALVVGALLVSSGLGSALAGRRPPSPGGGWPRVARAALFVTIVAGILVLAWPLVADQLRTAPRLVRAGVVAALLLPLGLAAGMPFPTALAALGSARRGVERSVATAWAVNGIFSVLGGLGATILALRVGFPAVAAAGIACYVAVAAAAAWTGAASRTRSRGGPD